MKQEDKDILLKDLCERLPYGVKVLCLRDFNHKWYNLEMVDIGDNEVYITSNDTGEYTNRYSEIEEVRPYLFPMSSMTKEQKEEYYSLADDITIKPGKGSYFGIKIHCIKLGISNNPHEGLWDWIALDAIDWLNKNHFDYRGLIEKGLAIDCTNLNIYES